jgi:hypothetical protein
VTKLYVNDEITRFDGTHLATQIDSNPQPAKLKMVLYEKVVRTAQKPAGFKYPALSEVTQIPDPDFLAHRTGSRIRKQKQGELFCCLAFTEAITFTELKINLFFYR